MGLNKRENCRDDSKNQNLAAAFFGARWHIESVNFVRLPP